MRDLKNTVSGGRGRLSAIHGEGGATELGPGATPVVPAHRILEIATALSDGATRMYAQLQQLEPAQRDAVLALMADQIGEIVDLWSALVREVIPGAASTAAPSPAPRRRPARATAETTPVGEDDDAGAPALRYGSVEIQAVPDPSAASPYRRRTPQPAEAGAEAEGLTRDELTGVLNRPAGFSSLGREIERCRQNGARFILGYLNVDGMRHVNDTHGPRAGDEVLRKVTAALRATLRSYDVIMRLGGDEFLFSLPGADMATAEQRMKEFAVILAEEAPGTSATVGFAELRHDDTLDDLVARADEALIQARRPLRRSR